MKKATNIKNHLKKTNKQTKTKTWKKNGGGIANLRGKQDYRSQPHIRVQ